MRTGDGVRRLRTARVFALLAALTAWEGAAHAKSLDVGVVLRLTDSYNTSGPAIDAGIETAKALFEKAHPSVCINLRRYSHGEDLASVIGTADQVIRDKLPAVIGGELSEESFVLRDRLGPVKTVFITPTSSNPSVTEGYPYSFRACFSDRLVSAQLARLTFARLKPKSVGVIRNVSSPYTDFLSEQYLAELRKLAGKRRAFLPILEEKVIRDTMDFGPQIRRFKERKVTHVALLTHQGDLLRFVVQANATGFYPVYVGSDGWGGNDQILKRLVKDPVDGDRFVAYRNSYWKEEDDAPIARAFRTHFQETRRSAPTAWNAIGFDSAWVLFTAMDRAENPASGEEIRAKLREIRGLPLVTTRSFSFGPDNSPRKDLYIYRIDKAGVKYEATLR